MLDTLKSFCYFLSLRYGADLGRSRLVMSKAAVEYNKMHLFSLHVGLQEDEFWILDPRNSSRHRSSTTSTSRTADDDVTAPNDVRRSCTTDSTLSLVSANDIRDTFEKHIREVESTTQLHSAGCRSKVFKVVFLGL